MKTTHNTQCLRHDAWLIMRNWLRCAAVLLLALAGSLTSSAQEEQIEGGEAFYIYQNDGHFDGFFYDQVEQIRYSRLDTLGHEHPDYVSQEIVTADSTYRIMLTAIDSVSFVQPEIRFAEGVRFMVDEGMLNYYVSLQKLDDGFLLRFQNTMPVALQPKVNDVLSCPKLPDYEDEAFVGKVKAVRSDGGNLVVECGYIEAFSDVFDQFVTVEQVKNVETPEGSRTIRRMAGLETVVGNASERCSPETVVGNASERCSAKAPHRVEGNYTDITLFNISFADEWLNIDVAPNVSFSFATNFSFGMQATAVYNITLSKFYIKTELKSQIALGATLALDGELYNKVSLKTLPGVGALVSRFGRVPFPAWFPILYADIAPEPFTDVQAHLNLSVNTGGAVKGTNFTLELKDEWPYVNMGLNFIAPFLPYKLEKEGSFSVNAQINGSVYSGMKFPIEVGTEEWIKKVCGLKSGTAVSAGPKVSGALNADLSKIGLGTYETLKDTKIDFTLMSITTEAEAEFTLFKKKYPKKRTWTWDYGSYPLTLFASVDSLYCNAVGDNQDGISCHYDVSGDVCMPQRLGVGIYVRENDNDIDYTKLYQYKTRDEIYFLNNFNSVDLQFDNLPTGDYRIRPIIRLATGIVPVITKEVMWYVGSMNMELTPQEGTFEEAGGEMVVAVAATMARPISAQCDEDWITTAVTQLDANGNGSVVVKVKPNDTDRFRTATVTVRQRYSPDPFDYLEKTFTVRQYGGLELENPKVEFDAKGGTETIELRTSMSPVTINLNGNDTWVTVIQDGNNLIITVKPNEGKKRTASVTITAWSEKNQGFRSIKLEIVQEGEPEGYAEVTPRVIEFPAYGGVTYVQTDYDYEYAYQWFSPAPTGPLMRSWGYSPGPYEKQITITAGPNNTDKATTDTLLVSFTNEKDGYYDGYMIPVIVKQAAGPSDVQEMRKLIEGTWISDYEVGDPCWQKRYVFNSDYTFSESERLRDSESKPWKNWRTPVTGTYKINSFKQYNNCITIYLKRTNESSENFIVVYPHDLHRLMYNGFYLNKEEQ